MPTRLAAKSRGCLLPLRVGEAFLSESQKCADEDPTMKSATVIYARAQAANQIHFSVLKVFLLRRTWPQFHHANVNRADLSH